MEPRLLLRPQVLLLLSVCSGLVSGALKETVINCADYTETISLGSVDEGYSGDVELVTGISPGLSVKLVPYIFPDHVQFLELVFTPGDTTATVRSREALDADVLASSDLTLYYSIMCVGTTKNNNTRTLKINDLNDNSPEFTKELYNTTVSETVRVGSEVLRVTAVDGDSTPTNNRVTYHIDPPSEDFTLTISGTFILNRPLKYNVAHRYNFTVLAKDKDGLNDTAAVLIDVEDYDNFNPYFSHSLYEAFIPENQIGLFRLILPEAVRAQDGDIGINVSLSYSIGSVSPEKYQRNFNIDSSSGVVSMVTAIDREEMTSSSISVSIKAAQSDDSLKTADTLMLVTVEDVNDNPPEFDQLSYSVTLVENSPLNTVVLRVAVTDRDQGGFVGTLKVLPESVPFSVDPDGTVRVKNSMVLDREAIANITFQIEARENTPEGHVALVPVCVTLLDENDNSPTFSRNTYEGKVFANQTGGMLLVQVTAEDPDADANGQVKYSIDFGNTDGYFAIKEDTGEITLTKTVPLEENRVLEFPLHVTARDGGAMSRSSAVVVTILAPGNSKPQFLQKVYRGTIEEEQEPGLVMKVDFLAIDTEVPVTLEVVTEVNKFSINSRGELSTKEKLDYDEAPHNYSVEITISDGLSSDSAVVEVGVTDINDNSPVFTPSSVSGSVPEDAELGADVATVTATDKDSGFNKEIRYSLRGGEGRFSVHPVSGRVTVAAGLDRETKDEYNLLVVAEDQGRPARSSNASLLVRVSDVNDNTPQFSEEQYQIQVSELEPVGTRLFTFSAADPDDGANGRVTYSISQQSPPSDPPVFELNSSNGTLWLAGPLDYSLVKEYSLRIQASDGGTPSLVGNCSVVVKVKDENNNPPEFSRESYDVAVFENLASGAFVLSLEVTDRDEGGFVGTLQISPESAPFSVDSDGTIRVKNSSSLDREATSWIVFQVEAREAEPPNHTARATVNVTLLDENDNSPKFTSSKYETKLFPNQTEDMLLVKVEAEDLDVGVNGQIKYSIEFGNQNDSFSIDEISGAITLTKSIPLEPHQTVEFLLFVLARDGGVVSRSASTQVLILGVGDTKPQFTQRTYSCTTEEERDPGTVITTVDFLATADLPVTLEVVTEVNKFSINSRGELSTKEKLDYDEAPHNYSVEITISDGLSSDSAVVEVGVTDINDNSPVFTPSSVSGSVPEDAELGADVATVTATDKDSGFNKEIRYSLRGGEGRFSVHPVSGRVTVAAGLDRETKAEYNLLVVAEDQGRPARSSNASLLVHVSDINDNTPQFSEEQYQIQVSELEPVGTRLFTFSAADPDDGANGRVTYSISQQSPPSDPPVFELNSSNGTLWLAGPLDYSLVKEYSLRIQASDGGTPSLVGNCSVVVKVKDENNNPPEFSRESYDVAVFENLASGAFVLSLEVTDRDEGGFVGTLQISPESAPFSVDSDGTIRVKNSSSLDREATSWIVFQVEAREAEPPNHTARATVNVTLLDENDNSPKFTSSKYETKIFPNQTEDMLLVKVEAEDLDVGVNGQIKYSIEFGNQNDSFSIDEISGAITLTKSIPLEPHQTVEFLLFVSARDGGVVSRSASTQVLILGVGETKPQFTQQTYSCTTEEEQDPGTVITTVDFLATADLPVTLEVVTEVNKFSINSRGELSTKEKLDYDEAPHNYSVEITISDGLSSDSAVVEVGVTDINDNSPVFTPSSVSGSVPEDAELGADVATVTATDKDSGFNKEIRYSLRGGEGRFSVHPVSGRVTVAAGLDRETKAEYNLLVVAEDQGRPARSSNASLLVRVSDVNDNTPQFSEEQYQIQVSELEPVGTRLFTFSAADPDDGANGRVTYSISQQSPPSDPPVFELNSSNGTLWLARPLDYSLVEEYSLRIQASDGGTPSLVGNCSVVVKVKDENNNPPEFSRESYDVAVFENLASGASILTLEVTDRDEGGFSNGHFLYTSDKFDINKEGVVSLMKNASLDRETTDRYTFQVVAVDQVPDGLRATAQVNITVLDYNDHSPQFPAIPDPLLILEGDYSEGSPGVVHTILPTDEDLGPNGEVTVSLSPPHPLFRFREDGALLAVGPLDREQQDTYVLVVTARDGGSPQRQNITTLRVRLLDVNDNAPEFRFSSYVSSILLKDAAAGKLLLTLEATDRDAGDNALITYSFSAGNSPHVAVNGETGAVTLTSDLADVTEDTTLSLVAVAEDHGRPPLNSTVPVVVNLRVASLVVGVAFSSSSYNFSLPENQPAGAMVGKVSASTGSDLFDVTYGLKTHADVFSVDASGAIVTRAKLDREEQEWFVLDVEAVDTQSPPTTAVAVVTVRVEDVNEPPQFPDAPYKASVLSIAPYRTPVITVRASDPDVGDAGQLVYGLAADSPHLAVEPSTGLVYVVSLLGLSSGTIEAEVTATDPAGLGAVTTVEVAVEGGLSSSDVVQISLNQPVNSVEEKVEQVESSLGSALGWTVKVVELSSGMVESRSLRTAARTLVSFIATDGGQTVPAGDVIAKLRSQSDAVRAELAKVFGEEVQVAVEAGPQAPAPDQMAVIVLGVLLGLSLLGLMVSVVLLVRSKRTKTVKEADVHTIEPVVFRDLEQVRGPTSHSKV